jgi:hypothetical protein
MSRGNGNPRFDAIDSRLSLFERIWWSRFTHIPPLVELSGAECENKTTLCCLSPEHMTTDLVPCLTTATNRESVAPADSVRYTRTDADRR